MTLFILLVFHYTASISKIIYFDILVYECFDFVVGFAPSRITWYKVC